MLSGMLSKEESAGYINSGCLSKGRRGSTDWSDAGLGINCICMANQMKWSFVPMLLTARWMEWTVDYNEGGICADWNSADLENQTNEMHAPCCYYCCLQRTRQERERTKGKLHRIQNYTDSIILELDRCVANKRIDRSTVHVNVNLHSH